MPTTPPGAGGYQPIQIALRALTQYGMGQPAAAEITVTEIVDERLDRIAVWLWTDFLCDAANGGRKADVQSLEFETPGGTRQTLDEVAPATAWAGQIITARLAHDDDAYNNLINALPADRDGKVLYLVNTLGCIVRSAQNIDKSITYLDDQAGQ